MEHGQQPSPEQGSEFRLPESHLDPSEIDAFLGAGRDRVVAFHDLLVDQGALRGLIGPREVPRLWQRHLLNSAAVAAFLPRTGSVADVGSGAGLPGIVLAAMRPDLEFHLVEPMERRCVWLREVVDELALSNVSVVRGRAEELAGKLEVSVVTARAVASLGTLVPWTLPLLGVGGVLLAMKGSRAEAEVLEARAVVQGWGGGEPEILTAATPSGVEETRVVRVVRDAVITPPTSRATPKAPRSRSRRPRSH